MLETAMLETALLESTELVSEDNTVFEDALLEALEEDLDDVKDAVDDVFFKDETAELMGSAETSTDDSGRVLIVEL